MTEPIRLTQWQKQQASLLHLFSSIEHLSGLKYRIDQIKSFAEATLQKSRIEGRDRFLRSAQWGDRNTSENWSNNAWQFLADFQISVAKSIVEHQSGIHSETDANYYLRGVGEFSMQWATVDEEKKFEAMIEDISEYARNIDYTMQKNYRVSRWSDFALTLAWKTYAAKLTRIPKFQVRTDVILDTGTVPPYPGVYMSIDDPHASLQFAWTGPPGGKLLAGSTFNELGLAALSSVGRKNLWINQVAMHDFIRTNFSHPDLQNDPALIEMPEPWAAAGYVARNAFTSCSTRWYYVELVDNEFEDASEVVDSPASIAAVKNRRFSASEKCELSGYYITPAQLDSRKWFATGDDFPHIDSSYGKTIWQWDIRQD